MARALFMASQDVPKAGMIERVVNRNDGPTGIAEDQVHAIVFQQFDHDFRAGLPHDTSTQHSPSITATQAGSETHSVIVAVSQERDDTNGTLAM